MTARSSASPRRFVLGRHGDLTAHATDHPYVAQVVDAAGQPVGVNDGHAHVFRLLKFGWELVEPPGWPNVDAHGRPVDGPAPSYDSVDADGRPLGR